MFSSCSVAFILLGVEIVITFSKQVPNSICTAVSIPLLSSTTSMEPCFVICFSCMSVCKDNLFCWSN